MADLAQFTAQNKFLMLALDHRGSFQKLLNPQAPSEVSPDKIIQYKKEIIESVSDQFSALLIDKEYGLPAYVNKVKPFLLPVEKSGYKVQDGERVTEIEYTVAELKQLGASGVKVVFQFHPNGETAVLELKTAHVLQDESKKSDMPLFLEIVTYGELSRQERVLRSLEAFLAANIRPDVWKLEYPGDAESCKKITEMIGETPWILLTAGEDFEEFKIQLKIAVENGCRGFLAGRALWKELFEMLEDDKRRFLKDILPTRFKEISEIVLSK